MSQIQESGTRPMGRIPKVPGSFAASGLDPSASASLEGSDTHRRDMFNLGNTARQAKDEAAELQEKLTSWRVPRASGA